MKGKHISKRSSRKLTNGIYQYQLVVYEWTPELQKSYELGQRFERIFKHLNMAIYNAWTPFIEAAQTSWEGCFLEIERRKAGIE